ncbi:MAG TPA: calcium-binding protein [Acidimicrobiales bacterium]|nr:calcium-binding protein [Acidimicrobiales bacterium]
MVDTLTNVADVSGASGATFLVGSAVGTHAYTFSGTGSSNSLDVSANSGSATVNVTTPTSASAAVTGGPTVDVDGSFTGFTGALGGTTFVSGAAGGYTFNGKGSGVTNTLNLTALSGAVGVDLAHGSVSGAGMTGTDQVTGINRVLGATAATSVVYPAAASVAFSGVSGEANSVDFSALPSGLVVDVAAGTATDGSVSDSFSNVVSITGASAGGTTFKPSTAGGITLTGQGTSAANVLDLSGLSSTVSAEANLPGGVLSGGGLSANDPISGFRSVIGSPGGTKVDGLSAAPVTFAGAAAPAHPNTFALGFTAGSTTVTFTGAFGSGTAVNGSVVDTLTNVADVSGASAAAFVVGSSAGTYRFSGSGTANSLDLSANSGSATVNVTTPASASAVVTGGPTVDLDASFTGFVGAAGGSDFVAGPTPGYSFAGKGSGVTNALDLSALGVTAPVVADLANGTVTGGDLGAGSDAVSGITMVVGEATAPTTVKVPAASSVSFAGGTGSNTIDLSALGSGAVVNLPNGTAKQSSVSDAFTGVTTVVGSAAGGTTFQPSTTGGYTLTGQGPTANTLDLTGLTTAPAVADLVNGLLSGAGLGAPDNLAGITTVLGSTAGATVDAPPSPSVTFTGLGSPAQNQLNLGFISGTTTVTLTGSSFGSGTAVNGSVTDTLADTGAVSGAKGAAFIVGPAPGSYTFSGSGGANVVDLHANLGAATVNLSGATSGTVASDSAVVAGGPTVTFDGSFTGFVGAAGGTDFLAGAAGGDAFSGRGSGVTNSLDLSAITGPLVADLLHGSVSGTGLASADTVSGITTVVGSAGGTTVAVGSAPVTFVGDSHATSVNALDLSGVGTGATVDLTGTTFGTGTVTGGGVAGTDAFSNTANLVASAAGSTTFRGGGTSGHYHLTGSPGTGNALDLSAGSSAATVDVSAGTASVGTAASYAFDASFTSFTGSPSGTQFFAGPAGGDAFVGKGSSTSANILDLSKTGSAGVTVNLNIDQVQGLTGGTTDSFTDLGSFNGSPGNDTFLVPTGGVTLKGGGGSDTLDLTPAPGSLTIDLGAGQVSGLSLGNVSFSGFSTVRSPAAGNSTFKTGATGGFTLVGQGPSDVLDLSGAAAGQTVNLGSGAITPLNDTLSGMGTGTILGGSANDTFVAGGTTTLTVDGAGGTNSLDLSQLACGVVVNMNTSNVSGPCIGTITFRNISNFTGSSGNDQFINGSPGGGGGGGSTGGGGITISGSGSNLLDLSTMTGPVIVNFSTSSYTAPNGSVVPAASAVGQGLTATLTNVTQVIGSNAGGNIFVVGPGNLTIDGGTGGNNTVVFASAPAGITLTLGATSTATGGFGGTDTMTSVQSIVGTTHDDHFIVGPGAWSLDGGGGSDTIDFSKAPTAATIDLSKGVASGAWGAALTLKGFSNVIGSNLGDTITTAASGVGAILAGSGNDTFILMGADETINGGGGTNTIDLSQVKGSTYLDLSDPTPQDTGAAGVVVLTVGTVQNVVASQGGSYLRGGPGGGTLTGGPGADTLVAGPGTVILNAGSGHDTLVGGSGPDTLNGGSAGTVFVPGTGKDFINGVAGATNTLDLSGAPGGAQVNLGQATYSGPGGLTLAPQSVAGAFGGTAFIQNVSNVMGTPFADVLVGDPGPNVINGGGGNDLIVGLGGGDTLIGGTGNVTFVMGGGGNNTVKGGAGSNTIDFSTAPAGVKVDLTKGVATGGWGGTQTISGVQNIVGSEFDDVLTAGPTGGIINGLNGNDLLTGSAGGHDTLTGGTGNDTFVCGAGGFDIVHGGSGNDTIFCRNNEPDTIDGGGGFNQAQIDPNDTVTNIQSQLP